MSLVILNNRVNHWGVYVKEELQGGAPITSGKEWFAEEQADSWI